MIKTTDDILEELLFEDESSSLDFKRDQYPFNNATDEQKAELLKDILAFANSWRRVTAYILIGVEEIKGGKSRIVGISNHLDDSNLQQFVNSKTQRPVEFSYQGYSYNGIQIGVIEVPIQERPIYLTKNYGGLKKDVVYLRRGSSTDEASPDEIVRIGIARVEKKTKPLLNLNFSDIFSREILGSRIELTCLFFNPCIDPQVFKKSNDSYFYGIKVPDPLTNSKYYDQLIDYVFAKAILKPVGFLLTNESNTVANDVELRICIPYQEGIVLINEDQFPNKPSKQITLTPMKTLFEHLEPQKTKPYVTKYKDFWEILIKFGKVLPKSKIWTEGEIFIGSNRDYEINFEAQIYAENLSEPICIPLSFILKTETRQMFEEDVENEEDED